MISQANFLWNGKPLSLYEYVCVSSFLRNGFKVQVFTYDNNLQIPDGAIRRDARSIMPENLLNSFTLSGQKGSMAGFADAFRCNLLQQEGGWWFDADVMCLKSADDFRGLVTSKPKPVSMGLQNSKYINNAVVYADDRIFVDALLAQLGINGNDVTWGENGPRLITKVANELGYRQYADPVETYYPFDGHDLIRVFDPEHREWCRKAFERSLAMHLWNDVIRRLCLPKEMLPPAGSFLSLKISEYCPELDACPKLPLDTMRSLFEHLRLQEVVKDKSVQAAIRMRHLTKMVLNRFRI